MKHLILFRHGKSSWDHPGFSDIDRPLLQKGEQRTLKMARYLQENQGVSDALIVSSNAERAYQTAAIVAGVLGIKEEDIVTEPILYHADTESIWDVIVALPDSAERVILFGHNPGFTDFINRAGIASIDWLPTSGIASAIYKCNHWHECPLSIPAKTFILQPSKI
jgi:phosphohistidine phosphatase